jgi:hypothetical protein
MTPTLSIARHSIAFVVVAIGVVFMLRGTMNGQAQQAAQPAQPLPPDAPFTVAVATSTLEAAPVYLAVARGGSANYRFINGGVRSLLNGGAHGATNAETQMLLAIDANPKIRMLFTLTDGLYRVVAKRSSGIRTVADLKGKRVVVPRNTSAHYSLVKILATAGLQESDVTLVAAPATEMALSLVRGEADAISMWEPESQNAVDALGSDAVIFSGKGIYREGFSFTRRPMSSTIHGGGRSWWHSCAPCSRPPTRSRPSRQSSSRSFPGSRRIRSIRLRRAGSIMHSRWSSRATCSTS